jgi:hypothetical protein
LTILIIFDFFLISNLLVLLGRFFLFVLLLSLFNLLVVSTWFSLGSLNRIETRVALGSHAVDSVFYH